VLRVETLSLPVGGEDGPGRLLGEVGRMARDAAGA
jgi:hypothetical protein